MDHAPNDHARHEERLASYVVDGLAAADRDTIAEQLRECARCRGLLASYRAAFGAVGVAATPVAPPAAVRSRVLARATAPAGTAAVLAHLLGSARAALASARATIVTATVSWSPPGGGARVAIAFAAALVFAVGTLVAVVEANESSLRASPLAPLIRVVDEVEDVAGRVRSGVESVAGRVLEVVRPALTVPATPGDEGDGPSAPSPARTSEPARTARPAETPEPDGTPEPAATPQPTKSPTPAPTVQPTKSPDPDETPQPTNSPTPAPTVQPTKSPDATRTPEPN